MHYMPGRFVKYVNERVNIIGGNGPFCVLSTIHSASWAAEPSPLSTGHLGKSRALPEHAVVILLNIGLLTRLIHLNGVFVVTSGILLLFN